MLSIIKIKLMSFKKYILLIIAATFFSIISFLLVVTKINPENTTVIGFILFYLSLFFTLCGVITLFMIAFRWIFIRNLALFSNITKSFRQGILFSTTAVLFLLLKSISLLRWWNVVLIIGLIIGIELFATSRKIKRS